MTDYPWFKFDVAQERVLLDVMTDEQYAAHTRLRLHAWTTGGIPNTEAELRTIARTTAAKWLRIWSVVSRYWTPCEGDTTRLVNNRQEEERQDAEARKTHGRRAIEERWKKARTSTTKPTHENYASNTRVVPELYQERREEESTEEERRERVTALSLVPAGLSDLSPGQLRASAPGLYATWNTVACVAPELKRFEADPPFGAAVQRALHAHPRLDWWSAIFAKVAVSDYLRGLRPGRDGTPFVATFWWVLENAAKIDADQYRNRDVAAMVDPNAASVAAAKLAMRKRMS